MKHAEDELGGRIGRGDPFRVDLEFGPRNMKFHMKNLGFCRKCVRIAKKGQCVAGGTAS